MTVDHCWVYVMENRPLCWYLAVVLASIIQTFYFNPLLLPNSLQHLWSQELKILVLKYLVVVHNGTPSNDTMSSAASEDSWPCLAVPMMLPYLTVLDKRKKI